MGNLVWLTIVCPLPFLNKLLFLINHNEIYQSHNSDLNAQSPVNLTNTCFSYYLRAHCHKVKYLSNSPRTQYLYA